MKLLTKELIDQLPKIKETEEIEDPICYVKLFHPFGSYTVYLLEYNSDQKLGFGLVSGLDVELGYIDINELETMKVFGIGMERDLYYTPELLSVVRVREEGLKSE